jgi:predicted acylesterase/phospholipase RssA
MTRLTTAAALLLLLGACSTPTRLHAPPSEAADRAAIPGYGPIRSWSDKLDEAFSAELMSAARREIELRQAQGETGLPPANYLALSGGGANGAYGAGLLCGWSETGTRPEFKVVTGISTGALTAPFAFLGRSQDERLRDFYTTTRTKDVLVERNILAGLFGDALTDSSPLERLLAKAFDQQVLDEIAGEYQKGRLLLVGTTNLDAQRGVIWNITAIAASGRPDALRLVHRVLLASASIPAAFPPVMIDVDVDGRRCQEMHVDGGALSQVFFYPPTLRLDAKETGIERERRLWVVRNSRLAPLSGEVARRTTAIAGRAIDSLILSQGLGDLYRIFLTSLRDGIDFNLAYIPEEFTDVPKELFDPPTMTKLFEMGRSAALAGTAWKREPPGFALPETRGGLTPAPKSKQD